MATRRYSIDAGQNEFQVTEAVGAAVVTSAMEFTVDLVAEIGDGNSSPNPRTLTREEVLEGLDKIRNYILSDIWPPA